MLGWAACGVIFGDIGTSPLYVFSSTFTAGPPTENDVLGAMSIIFWSITLLVVVSRAAYCCLSVQAVWVPRTCARGHACTLQCQWCLTGRWVQAVGCALKACWQHCSLSPVQPNDPLHVPPLHCGPTCLNSLQCRCHHGRMTRSCEHNAGEISGHCVGG